jgi:hypothetical protein
MPRPSQAHLARVSSLSGPVHVRYPAGYHGPRPGRRRTAARVFPLPFGCRHSLDGHPFPPGIPPLLRSAYRPWHNCRLADHDGVYTFRTHETRPEWAPSLPRDQRCSHGPQTSPARRLPSLTGTGPAPRSCHHLSGAYHNEASTKVHAIHPPGLPLARSPQVTRVLLRLLPRAPHPHGQDPCTHAGAGTGSEH